MAQCFGANTNLGALYRGCRPTLPEIAAGPFSVGGFIVSKRKFDKNTESVLKFHWTIDCNL